MAEKLTLQVGKYYKTRDGRKATVLYVVPESTKSDVPVVVDIDGKERRLSADGRYLHRQDWCFDLIAEWREPVTRTVTVALVQNDEYIGLDLFHGELNKAAVLARWTNESKLVALKHVTITEGEFDGGTQ